MPRAIVRTARARTKTKALQVVRNPYAAPAKKSSRATYNSVISSFSSYLVGEPEDGESFDRLLLKYGRSVSWVYIAVNRIANAAAQIPYQLVKADRKGKPNAVVDGPANGLRRLLSNPNPYYSWFDFVNNIQTNLDLTGNAFIELAELDASMRPHELYCLNPAKAKVVPGPHGPQGYVYDVNGTKIKYRAEEIIHIKYTHPANDWYGIGPLAASALSLELDRGAMDWNRNFLAKGAWPAGAIETENDIGDEAAARLKTEIKKIAQRGKEGVGQILLLTGGLKYHSIALSPKEVDWLDARRMSRDEILAIFGCPFAVAGLFSNEQTTARSAGVNQQVVNFYLFTIFPKIQLIYSALNRALVSRFPGGLELCPDYRNIPALKDDVQKELYRAQAFRTLTASGWSVNMGLAELYPHVSAVPWGDVMWVNQAMVPIAGAENPYVPTVAEQAASRSAAVPLVPTDPNASDGSPTPPGKRVRTLAHRLGINSGADDALAAIAERHPLVTVDDDLL